MSAEQIAWNLYQAPGKLGLWCLARHRQRLASLVEKWCDGCGWTSLFYKLYQVAKKS